MNKRIGVAMWHYHHRTTTENACFFADCGYDVLGLNQWQIIECILKDGGVAKFKEIGTEKSKGTKVFALAGKVKNIGQLLEYTV